jgi:ABC-2 type transport system ATP-binding protein
LSVIENLIFHASYFGSPRAQAARRGDELLEQFGLTEKRDAKVDALSGGQQQRLMIARALSHEPSVIFLDEPTVGLDPQARLALWEILRGLHREGRTIVMTTHYMEEADQLCDRLAIIDQGKLLALDTPSRLKAQAPGDTLVEVTFDDDAAPVVDAASALEGVSKAEARGATLRVFSRRGGELIPALIAAGESQGRTVRDIHLSRPSLETLFISLTGRKLA